MHVFLTSNHWFPLNFSTHNVALSLEKNPNQERNVHRSITVYKQKQSKAVLNKYVGGVWCERTTAFLAGRHYYVLWTCIFARRNVKLKCLDGFVAYINTAFWLHNTLTDELEQGSSNLILEGRVLQILAPTCLNTPAWKFQVVRAWLAAADVFDFGAKLCRTPALQDWTWRPLN